MEDFVVVLSCESHPGLLFVSFSIPFGLINLGSPPSYGAFQRLEVTSVPNCQEGEGSHIQYLSEYGETYVVIITNATASHAHNKVHFRSTCTVSRCHASQYMNDGICQSCPTGSVSKAGSTSIQDCLRCRKGFVPRHHKSPECMLDPHSLHSDIATES